MTNAPQLLNELDLDILTHSPGSEIANKYGTHVIELARNGNSLLLTPQLAVQIGEVGKRAIADAGSREQHQALPVAGYTAQSGSNVELVNEGKTLEERVLRYIEKIDVLFGKDDGIGGLAPGPLHATGDKRFLAIGKADIQKGFMMVYRAVFNPQRIKLPEDYKS